MISVSGFKIYHDTGNISNTPVLIFLTFECPEIGQIIGYYLNNSKYSEAIGSIQNNSEIFRIIEIEIPEVNSKIVKKTRYG